MLRTSFFIVLWLFSFSNVTAQLILLKGNTQQRINIDSYLEIGINTDYNCCDRERILGQLHSVSTDSIYLSLKSYQRTMSFEVPNVNNTILKHNLSSTGGIAKSNIYFLNKYPNKKYRKKSDTRKAFGGMLMVTGIVTGLHYFIAADDSKDRMLISGFAQIGVGILLFKLFDKEEKYTFNGKNSWQIN